MLFLFPAIVPAQVYSGADLPLLMRQARNDSIHKIERLAAGDFHLRINKYRQSMHIDTLSWDDTMWVAARNHCAWMNANSELSHGEKKNTPCYTGEHPGDRYGYAREGKEAYAAWSGENVLYNWENAGNSIEQIANSIAEYSFVQWKNSPGHNANMLAKGSSVHAVAFLLGSDGRVWATDLFSWNVRGKSSSPFSGLNEPKEPVAALSQPKKAEKKNNGLQSSANKFVKLDLASTTADLTAALYDDKKEIHRDKAMEKAAQAHAVYVAGIKKLAHEEKKGRRNYYGATPEQRLHKASHGKYAFAGRKLRITESVISMEADAANLDLPALAASINEKLGNDPENIPPSKTGYGISIKRVKNILTIYVVRVSGYRR
jgi:uncharacterized protein YkwD